MIAIIPKKMKVLEDALETYKGEEIPAAYHKVSKEMQPYNLILHVSAVILIILMSIKPF